MSGLEDFSEPTFDVHEYTKSLLANNASISENLSHLASRISQVDEALKVQISNNHEKLLSQASTIESLEDILSIMSERTSSLTSNATEFGRQVNELYDTLDGLTTQLKNIQRTSSLVRSVQAVLKQSAKLKDANSLPTSSELIQAIYELTMSKDGLKRIRIVEDEVNTIPKRRADCLQDAQKLFRNGLTNGDEKQVALALQCFRNMKAFKEQIRFYMDDLSSEFERKLKRIFESTARSSYSSLEGRTIPGSASLPNISVASAVQSSLWPHMSELFRFVEDVFKQLTALQGVTMRRRDAVSHKLWSELVDRDEEDRLWRTIADELQQRFSDHTAFGLTFQSNYPQLLRMINGAFGVPTQLTVPPRGESPSKDYFLPQYEAVRKSAQVLENAFVGKSLSRMFSSVESAFDDPSRGVPDKAATEIVVKSISFELSAVEFDRKLFAQVVRNATKAVETFCRKCEDKLQLGGEAFQVIDNPTLEQKNNTAIVNCLTYIQRFLMPLCDHYGNLADSLRSSLTAIQSIQRNAVQPLVQSVIDAVTAIVVTMHQEKFEASLEAFKTVPQCSLYMRELQEFLSRVQKQFLSPFESCDYIKEVAIEIAQETCRFFVLHATLLRPLSNHRRLCLAADCAQVELIINILCDRVSDVGEPYHILRAYRPLLVQSAEEIADACLQPGFCIPLSVIIQLLISMSPEELPSPHKSIGWSLIRYAEWFENHPSEADRISFLRGAVDSYAKHVIEQEKPQYVVTYPLIMKVLDTAIGSA